MSRRVENPLTFRSLYESPVVAVREYQCRAARSGPSAEEYSDTNNIVLMRHGAFARHFGRRSSIADVNQAVFFSAGSTYRVSHPGDCGDCGTILVPAQAVLNAVIRDLDPSIDDHPERPFPFATGPCSTTAFWRGHGLVRDLDAVTTGTAPLDPLQVDEAALDLVASTVCAAYGRHTARARPRRDRTDSDHADRADAAKSYLAAHLSDRVTLEDVARAAHASPFHLTRLFQRCTGMPVHRYLTCLRLRTALQHLADGAHDLSALALELGFSSHSHFTDCFRREFGAPPSQIRRTLTLRRLREMSKNLEV